MSNKKRPLGDVENTLEPHKIIWICYRNDGLLAGIARIANKQLFDFMKKRYGIRFYTYTKVYLGENEFNISKSINVE